MTVSRDSENQHDVRFRPRARLVSVLGEHLISDQAVGLVELVKNAYDADATEVEVQILGLARPETTAVIIRDNGSGMTLEDVKEKWLSPAVDHKERDKRANRRTPLGRLPIGEKGVGRFAVHQIGRKMELVTRAKEGREIVVPIDWDQFERGDEYLDTMTVTVKERNPEVFTGTSTGTLIRIEHARSQWTRQLLEKVHRTLRRLQSPVQDKETRFRVVLKCPDYPEYENVDPTDILEKAHYEFQALVDADGQCDYEYRCKHPALPPRTRSGSQNLAALASRELQGPVPACGPFWINLYVWDRTRDFLAQTDVSAKELNAQCGVSLFRDGLRVLPYGEPGDDWLLLDQERIQDPSGKIGNNQVIGIIQVLQERNLQLRDKTNREGLIENDAFRDLKAMSRAAIRLFISHWRKDRPREEGKAAQKEGSLAAAKEIATAIRDTASDEVKLEIPAAAKKAARGPGTPASAAGDNTDHQTVTQKQAVDILISNLDGAASSVEETERRAEKLLSLAATGLAAERVVHEFGRQVASSMQALADVRRRVGSDVRAGHSLGVLEACLETLRDELRILAPYESVDRARRARECSIRESVELALMINKRFIEEQGIRTAVRGKEFEVKARPASLVQVFDNLIHNACYWLASLPAGRQRQLLILLDASRRRVFVADTGPGVHEEAREHLFEPFFSMKAGGTGLGLYISAEIMRRMSGAVRLAHSGELPPESGGMTGAVFVVEFAA